jgi:hypothetical protein
MQLNVNLPIEDSNTANKQSKPSTMIVNRLKLFKYFQIFINMIETLTELFELNKMILVSILIASWLIQIINTFTNSRIY